MTDPFASSGGKHRRSKSWMIVLVEDRDAKKIDDYL
jgi:hypothetical protein